METQTLYQNAIKFATARHEAKSQKVKGTELPYVVHLSNVAMEILIAAPATENFNLDFAIQVALLHDTLEDTQTEFAELETEFGSDVANAVNALSKNKAVPKADQMNDSIARTKKLQPEVWAIKLADRITNLQPPPPNWSDEKRFKYQEQARMILSELGSGNNFLAKRLAFKIEEYGNYISK